MGAQRNEEISGHGPYVKLGRTSTCMSRSHFSQHDDSQAGSCKRHGMFTLRKLSYKRKCNR